MSGIYGIIRFDGAPVDPADLATMRAAMAEWGPEGGTEWHAGVAGMGQLLLIDTPEAAHEVLPRVMADGKVLTAAARIDNREDLFRELSVPHELRDGMPDSVLIERAYLRWGEDCAVRLLGDWSFAVWDPATRRFFLARDHHGNTALYYTVNERFLAFASGRKALLALDIGPVALDDLYIAQVLLAWPAYHGERTVHIPIKRLPPSHTLVATGEGVAETHRYWYMEDVTEIAFKTFDEYVEAFLEIWDEAVRARVRSSGPVGVMMSGGLDSTSVAATAAMFLRERGERLQAYTSVPIYDTTPYVPKGWIGNEWPLAKATADYVGNIDLHAVTAEDITPLEGVYEALRVHQEPVHAAANAYWMAALQRVAREQGTRVLLTGQGGNLTVSWRGLPNQRRTPSSVARGVVRAVLPRRWLIALRSRRLSNPGQYGEAALSPGFAQSTGVVRRYAEGTGTSHSRPDRVGALERRLTALMPGQSVTGVYWAQRGAVYSEAIRDPTVDVRVISYSLGVPDRYFRGSEPGQSRWLIRSAMAGRLPSTVRMDFRRGQQNSDLLARMRTAATAASLSAQLESLSDDRVAAYVNVPWLRQTWDNLVMARVSVDLHVRAVVFLRSLLAGLFVEGATVERSTAIPV